jgi:restriction system protein
VSVPTYDQFIGPLLYFLAGLPDGAPASNAKLAMADAMALSEAQRTERIPSGSLTYAHRTGWAHDRLKRAGLSASKQWGHWKLTEAGVDFAKAYPKLSESDLKRIIEADELPTRPKGNDPGLRANGNLYTSPEERIDVALAELRESVARDLLDNIGRSDPEFFEHLVLELLHAMGYGTDRSDLQRVGGSGDGGIDGIISLDRLGLEKVYVQAKRWKNSVGSPEIQGFMGALQLQGASKGVFITTSTFTKDARGASEKARGSIVLVDGQRLANLMIDHGVGVSHKAIRVPKVDNDYFDEV